MSTTRIKNAVPNISVNLHKSPEFLGGFILWEGMGPNILEILVHELGNPMN